jgi:hypothetical protein
MISSSAHARLILAGGLFFFLWLQPQPSSAQLRKSKILLYDTSSYSGNISLNDGATINGRITFNDDAGVVSLREGNDSKSFTTRDVLMFQFLDPESNSHKRFYSLEFTDEETGLTDFCFFEVLKEFKSFVVLAKIDRLKTEARKGILQPKRSPLMVGSSDKKYTQTETIYFMNDQGEFEAYLKIVEKEIQGTLVDVNDTNNKLINAKLFEQYTGIHFRALVDFAKRHDLSFKERKDIITILNEYERLVN